MEVDEVTFEGQVRLVDVDHEVSASLLLHDALLKIQVFAQGAVPSGSSSECLRKQCMSLSLIIDCGIALSMDTQRQLEVPKEVQWEHWEALFRDVGPHPNDTSAEKDYP